MVIPRGNPRPVLGMHKPQWDPSGSTLAPWHFHCTHSGQRLFVILNKSKWKVKSVGLNTTCRSARLQWKHIKFDSESWKTVKNKVVWPVWPSSLSLSYIPLTFPLTVESILHLHGLSSFCYWPRLNDTLLVISASSRLNLIRIFSIKCKKFPSMPWVNAGVDLAYSVTWDHRLCHSHGPRIFKSGFWGRVEVNKHESNLDECRREALTSPRHLIRHETGPRLIGHITYS